MVFFKQLIAFVQNVAKDPRIPEADKRILLVLIGLILSPIDLIPDWLPVVGVVDDFVILGIVLDYFFTHLDQEILLSHYPWGMRSYLRARQVARLISLFTPGWMKKKVWSFKPSVYH
ncbi:MAG: YkvA family protein [Bdellovibrionales bacterium]